MKKFTLLNISVIFIFIFAIFSCKKFDENIEASDTNNYLSRTVKIKKEQYRGNDGKMREILVFSTDDDYFKKVDELEELAEAEEQKFLKKYPNATEEEINRYDSIENFDEYKVYKDFAQSMNFDALLYDYIDTENKWLNSDLDERYNPYRKFFGLDESELSILNKDFSYKIKNNKINFIIKHFPDGVAVITDGNYETLNHLSEFKTLAKSDVKSLKNVQYSYSSSSSCTSWNREVDYRTIGNGKRLYGITRVTRYYDVWGWMVSITKVKAKAKTVKKRWWCNCWRRYRVSHIKAAIDGELSLDYCNGQLREYFNKNNNFKEKRNRSSVTYRFPYPPPDPYSWPWDRVYIADDKLWGYFYANGTEWFKLDFYDGDFVQIH